MDNDINVVPNNTIINIAGKSLDVRPDQGLVVGDALHFNAKSQNWSHADDPNGVHGYYMGNNTVQLVGGPWDGEVLGISDGTTTIGTGTGRHWPRQQPSGGYQPRSTPLQPGQPLTPNSINDAIGAAMGALQPQPFPLDIPLPPKLGSQLMFLQSMACVLVDEERLAPEQFLIDMNTLHLKVTPAKSVNVVLHSANWLWLKAVPDAWTVMPVHRFPVPSSEPEPDSDD